MASSGAMRALVLALLATTLTNAFLQPDDEDLMFDDEDGTKSKWESEAPVAAPWPDAVSRLLPRPRRQVSTFHDDDYGSGSGFEPHTYRIKMHVLVVWTDQFADRTSQRFGRLSRRIRTALETVYRDIGGETTMHVARLSRSQPGRVLALVDVMVTDIEDHRAEVETATRRMLASGKLGDLDVNQRFFEFTEPQGTSSTGCGPSEWQCPAGECVPRCNGVPDCYDASDELGCPDPDVVTDAPETTTTTRLECTGDSTPRYCSDGTTIACFCDSIQQCPDGEDERDCDPGCPLGLVKCEGEQTCIYEEQKCDGYPDCDNNWDELGCPPTITPAPPTTTTTRLQCTGDRTPAYCYDGTTLACFCDSIKQCPGGEDERDCHEGCPLGQVKCEGEDTCIYEEQKCDGYPDCDNRWDELASTCDPTTTTTIPTTTITARPQCTGGSTLQYCADRTTLACFCDSIRECSGGEDEANCRPPECPPGQQRCRDGVTCIYTSQFCDGSYNCPSGSDEENCPPPVTCPEGYFRCFEEGNCINITQRCDGLVQCMDGSDERGCPCKEWQWTCRDGGCIREAGRCDGTIDCADKSDELGCPPSGCRQGQFTCGEGSCIPEDDRCNGIARCPDGSDEEGCPPQQCGPTEFTCRDNTCIPAVRKCDGYRDCPDNSDELNCPPEGCRDDQFTCLDGSCVPLSARCDRSYDCLDRSDEENCPPRCGPGEFACDDGGCISEEAHCDGYAQCRDGSDERGCIYGCRPGELQCGDGSCVPGDSRCDGLRDCRDGTDESGCPTPPGCQDDEFTCRDGTCVLAYQRCDGIANCPDNSDEDGCAPRPPGCRRDEWTCLDGACLPQISRCDGQYDCLDRSDEQNCPPTPTCGFDDWRCDADGTCLPQSTLCNGRIECSDGSDERNCPTTCKPDEFACADDGTCIPSYLVCDGRPYCRDESDERDCSPCRPDQHLCERDGTCIRKSQVCDSRPDCSDASDEFNCPVPCGRDEWQCSNGQCIPQIYHCDGRQDCSDNSDETVECGLPPPPPTPPNTPRPPRPGSCSANQFECLTGNQCIQRAYKCDGIPDCEDGSDEGERECTPQPCPLSNQFACTSGGCIGLEQRCDGQSDCIDNSDELGCPVEGQCSEDQFTCSDGSCIEKDWLCDEVTDCLGGDDEEKCCMITEFRCGDGTCIPEHFRCDNKFDCTDGSDERDDCVCRPEEFTCNSGECVPNYVVCDGNSDCRDGSDENNEKCNQCAPGQFQCNNRQCIGGERRCDGIRDCSDGSDESGCTPLPPVTTSSSGILQCQEDEFECRNGDCIYQAYYCDGRYDCADRSDEDACTITTTPRPPTPIPPQNDGELNLRTYPDEQPIKQTQEVVFQCRDEGTRRAPVRWVREGGRRLPPGSTDIRGRLTMPNIQLEHAGTYYCEAQGVPTNTRGWRKPVYLQVVPYEIPTVVPTVVCTIRQATCMSGECIDKDRVCDGRPDCKDSSDEMRCDPNGCEPNEFKCDNRKCVLKTWLCDTDDDCGDGSDEKNCGVTPPGATCRNNEFTCKTRSQCIPKSFHCDTDNDCHDASDEVGCSKPIVVKPPPRNVVVQVSETFTLTCQVLGVPTPIVLWRLNWGHVPSKCEMTSEDGFGTLVCPDAQPTDQGAYSCEAINGKGSVFATPDAIVVVKGTPAVVCQPPSFNSLAVTQEDCLSCFCFGITDKCYSSDMYVTQLPPPNSGSFGLVGANQNLNQGNYVVRDNDYPLSSRHLTRNPPGSQYPDQILLNVDRSKLKGPGDLVVYFSLPDTHKGQQLSSYGGFLHYKIRYSYFGASQTTSHPDIIIRGNNMTLMHVYDGTFRPDVENQVDVRFFYGQWFKRVVQWGGRIQIEQPATREEIMMVLGNMDLLLIRALYTDGDFINTTLSNVHMDTAQIPINEQGKASLVERCICPQGYTGISCQNCAPNYSRVKEGPWLGRCVYDLECGPNEYGDPTNGIECLPCPCPHSNPSNQFSSSCYLANDGQVTCNCRQGYEGRRCQYCASGYEGNPSQAGDYCKPASQCDPAGSAVVNPTTGYCECKEFATGPRCDQCKADTFYLSEKNSEGCIPCFCMGITSRCSSSNLYRQQEYALFTNDRQGFEVVDSYGQNFIRDDLFVDSGRQELIFQDFPRYGQKVYYWKLPQRFLGNKVTSYGGNLTYTLRFVPAPGGQSSTNNAFDVEIFGNDITLQHFRQGQPSLSPTRQETVSVPLYEQYWQRQSGQEVNREHLMMALADLEHVHIKATYTTATEEVGLKDITLDYAEVRNTGQERAHAVEMCDCPKEYQGSSCEDCAIGYTRSLSGVHLGTCVPCDCSGHSTECDPNTGICFDCKNNTAGNYCELCAPGYNRYGDNCYPDNPSECVCDPRGNVRCERNRCQCKAHVTGTQCDSCRPGYFHLSADNPAGCLPCWCSGASSQCFSSNYYREQIPMQLLSNHGFTFSNRLQTDVIQDGFNINLANNEISFSSFDNLRPRETYFWSLPQLFTGNRLESYGGNLTVTQRFQTQPGGNTYSEADVIIRSTNGREFIWMTQRPLQQNIEQTYIVQLTEDSFTMNQQPASRSEFLQALSSVEAILIRATLSEQMSATFLSDVVMDTAVPRQTGQPRALEVEQCRCPMEYSGLSCEMCRPGYYRSAASNRCIRCPCNGREASCAERPDGGVQCECLPGYYGPSCEHSGTPDGGREQPAINIEVTISEPSIKVVTVNSTVQLSCSARSVVDSQARISVTWNKAGGELPYGRARDNRQGLLVITEVRPTDSGVYICAAVDEYGRVVTDNVTLTVSRERPNLPNVILEPQQGSIDVGVSGSLVVRCSVEGSRDAQVFWTYGPNRPLPANVYQQNGVLTFRDAQQSDSGEYYCTSTNAYGQGIARIYINVVTVTTITVQVSSENVVTTAGETVRVACSAGSSPGSLTIEWSRVSGLLPTQAVVERGELQIPSAQPADSGTYVCRITDRRTSQYNEASTRITITEYRPSLPQIQPTVLIQPDRQTINQGTNAELLCRVTGDPPPVVTWTKANEQHSSRVTIENNILRITNAQVSDRGMYVCTATNQGGSAQAAAIIEVERREPPQIQMHPAVRQTIDVGGSALFQCHLTAGIPSPTVQWTRTDGQQITANTEILSGGVLRFNQVRGDEAGSYLCTAENAVGSATAVATLEIQSLPTIDIRPGPSPYTVNVGERVQFECIARGDPAPSVSWKKLQVNFPTAVPSVSRSPGVAVYEIASVSKADEGTYMCSAKNSAGINEKRLQLLVEDGSFSQRLPPLDDNKTIYVPAGSPYEFICSGTGPDAQDLQFTFRRSDNRPLPAGARTDEGTLYLPAVDETASGEYACVASDRISGVIRFTIYTTIRVLVPPRISLDPARQVVRPGEVVRIRCSATGPQPITINWSKEVGRMPASVVINGGELTFRGIATTDAGRYICTAQNNAGTTRAVAEVVVNEEPLVTATEPRVTLYVGQTAELRCETSGINPNDVRWTRVGGRLPPGASARGNILRLPLIELQDRGEYQCEAILPSGQRLYDIVTLVVQRSQTSNIQIRSIPPNVRRGEDVELICEVENEPSAAISWQREDDQLPYGSQPYGNRLRIPAVQTGGLYVCTATTRQGSFDQRYALVVRDIISQSEDRFEGVTQLRSENTRSVALGLSVKMECHLSLPGPVSYTWSKKDGKLPANARTQDAVLDISEVQAADAGVYVCTSRNAERAVDLATLLTVTGVVPRFNENSYLALQTLRRAYLMFDIEISFKPESPDGLILYNSQRAGPDEGDFVAFGLVGGYPEFRFNIGAGPAVIRGTQPLEMNQWHTVNLSRNRKEGRMRVNGGEPLVGVSQGRFLGLDLVEPLYLGGVPDFQNVHRQTGMTTGFKGCISRLVTGNTLKTGFVLNASKRVGITSCETCAANPCHNNGVCQEAYNERGHKCFCPAGYLGELCENAGESCYDGACGTGRCINKPGGFECYCPFGKIGDRCSQDISIYEPAFGDESYIAFPTPMGRRRFAVDMNFKPETLDDGVLMYCAQKESGSGDFASLSIRNKRLEFRFNSGSGSANIQSDPINEGEWIKVRVNRTDKMGSLTVNDGPMVTGESPGRNMGLNLLTPLFIGGIDNSRIQVSPDVGVKNGFRGCVSEIKVMDREVRLGEAVVESANVDQCGDAASPCSRSPCQNSGACVDDLASPHGYACHCPEGYSGENCQHEPGVCTMIQPCTNGGACVGQGHDYICLCPLGHAGSHCEHTVPKIGGSAAFSENSWVELNRTLLPQEAGVPQVISFEFRTRRLDSLLFWYGQDPSVRGLGQDYISIAVKNGYIEFSYELGGGPAVVRSQSRVDDGRFHNLRVERAGQQGVLTLDREAPQVTQSPGQLHMLNADGNIYIGGVPDFALMTGGTHTSGFVGCIQRLLIGSTNIDNFLNYAISGVNVTPCLRRRKLSQRGKQEQRKDHSLSHREH